MAEPTIKPRYVVVEFRTNEDGTMSDTVKSYDPDDKAHAEEKYHTVLAAAAISAKPIHSCALMTSDGFTIEYKCYKRGAALPTETALPAE